MARIKDLVRQPTLKKYLGSREVKRVDVFELTDQDGGGYQVRIEFGTAVEGEKLRWLTTYRNEDTIRTFRSLDAVWKLLNPLGADEIHVYDKTHIAKVPEL